MGTQLTRGKLFFDLQVAYYYDPDIGTFYYGQGHPMKPHRVRMAHSLILHYGLYEQMECYRPNRATEQDMTAFHAPDYVQFLRTVTPDRLVRRVTSVILACAVTADYHNWHCL
jgi:acetoin utilization deacetylase AcuC-like enzyme